MHKNHLPACRVFVHHQESNVKEKSCETRAHQEKESKKQEKEGKNKKLTTNGNKTEARQQQRRVKAMN